MNTPPKLVCFCVVDCRFASLRGVFGRIWTKLKNQKNQSIGTRGYLMDASSA